MKKERNREKFRWLEVLEGTQFGQESSLSISFLVSFPSQFTGTSKLQVKLCFSWGAPTQEASLGGPHPHGPLLLNKPNLYLGSPTKDHLIHLTSPHFCHASQITNKPPLSLSLFLVEKNLFFARANAANNYKRFGFLLNLMEVSFTISCLLQTKVWKLLFKHLIPFRSVLCLIEP